MARELVEAFNQASDDDEVGAIVVTGAGLHPVRLTKALLTERLSPLVGTPEPTL